MRLGFIAAAKMSFVTLPYNTLMVQLGKAMNRGSEGGNTKDGGKMIAMGS